MRLLCPPNYLRYWKFFKQEYLKELIDKQNCEAIFKARQMDVEAIVRRQIAWMDKMIPNGKIVIEHSGNLMCNSEFCTVCRK